MGSDALQDDALQQLCDRGQAALMSTDYVAAEALLQKAERLAVQSQAWDTLSRLYMPLQEARRQRRQKAGEGIVRLDLIARGPAEVLNPVEWVNRYPHGQFLVAGWGTLTPAVRVRELQRERGLYAETFLAAVFPVLDHAPPAEAERVVVLVPFADTPLPDPTPRARQELYRMLPPTALAIPARDLPVGEKMGTTQTYAEVMALWERLHAPYLKAADAMTNPTEKMEAYRKTIEVDSACELAHQRLSDVAGKLVW